MRRARRDGNTSFLTARHPPEVHDFFPAGKRMIARRGICDIRWYFPFKNYAMQIAPLLPAYIFFFLSTISLNVDKPFLEKGASYYGTQMERSKMDTLPIWIGYHWTLIDYSHRAYFRHYDLLQMTRNGFTEIKLRAYKMTNLYFSWFRRSVDFTLSLLKLESRLSRYCQKLRKITDDPPLSFTRTKLSMYLSKILSSQNEVTSR